MRLALACALIAAMCLGIASTSTPSMASDRALVLLKSGEVSELQATVASMESLGAHVGHVIPPRTLIANVPAGVEALVAALTNVAEIHRGPVVAEEDTIVGAAAWNHLLEPMPAVSEAEGEPLTGDAFEPPQPAQSQAVAGSNAPGTYQTSSFMIGKVAVGVILPESNSGTEDWSAQRQTDVFNRIVSGLDWWVQKGGSAAHLTFYYDQRFSVPTQYEPITMQGMSDQETWVSDIFQNMGYTSGSSRFDRAAVFLNDLRNTYHTDWAFTFIVVDSLNDSDGKFPDGYFGWAYLGGPYVIMTYDNDGWGISRMGLVATHETGHIFRAADEYCQPGYACCDFRSYGYLYVYNGNCEKDNPNTVPCIMSHNDDSLCQYTWGQVGWRDTDSDGKPDPVDTAVSNIITGEQESQGSPWDVSLSGTAADVPCPGIFVVSVTINTISAVKYRVDSGPWQDATPVDGAFDEDIEDYIVTAPALATGDHLVQTQAFSTSGNSSNIAGYTVHVPQIGYSALSTPFAWVDPSEHTALSLGDDTVSPPQMIPFPFTFYGTTYNQLYVGSNGLIGFSGDNVGAYVNLAIPSVATPNAAIYAYWDDLNPFAGGNVWIGVTGSAPHRRLVVSWVGVPHFLSTSYLTFQALLCEDTNDLILQYLEVQPGDNSFGAGRSATVGIESASGTSGLQYSLNGTPLLYNGQALLFTRNPSIPGIKSQQDGQSVETATRAVTYASRDVFYIEEDSRTSGIRVYRPNHGLSPGMRAYVKCALATDSNGERYISASATAHYGEGSIQPLFMTHGALTGPGLSAVGLLVRTAGRVTTAGPGYVYIDDGSGLRDGSDTGGVANVGVRVVCDPASLEAGDVIAVTGVVSRLAGAGGMPAKQILVDDAANVSIVHSRDRSISGRVLLQDYVGTVSEIPLAVEVRRYGQTVIAVAMGLGPAGEFTVGGIPAGTYDLAFKASHWLRRVVHDVDVRADARDLSVALINGDAYVDNYTDIYDFAVLMADWGTSSARADLNGDGVVDDLDVGVLNRNWHVAGDP